MYRPLLPRIISSLNSSFFAIVCHSLTNPPAKGLLNHTGKITDGFNGKEAAFTLYSLAHEKKGIIAKYFVWFLLGP